MSAGGKRPGAGRPVGTTKDDAKRAQVNVRLTDAEIAKVRGLGKGNAAEGIRLAIAAWPGGRHGLP